MRGGDEAIGNLIVAGYLAIGFIPIILALRFYFKDTAAARKLLFLWLFSTLCVLFAFALTLLIENAG